MYLKISADDQDIYPIPTSLLAGPLNSSVYGVECAMALETNQYSRRHELENIKKRTYTALDSNPDALYRTKRGGCASCHCYGTRPLKSRPVDNMCLLLVLQQPAASALKAHNTTDMRQRDQRV
jgi:hypothetical protein